jgi:aspartate aminotransferase
MQPLSQNVLAIPPQGVRVIMDLAWQTPGAIHLEVGEPNFPTPAHVTAAAIRAAATGDVKYTANTGIPSLRAAIAAKMGWYNGVTVAPEQVVVTPGGVAALAGTLLVIAQAGDRVLVPEPCWPNGKMWLGVMGAVPVPYTLRQENGFLPDLEELERLAAPGAKALIVNSPGNPTGAVFPEQTVLGLLAFCRRHDLWLISDEIYEQIIFEGQHVSPARFDEEGRVITLSGLSKAYAMTGWRVGYAVANREIAAQLAKLQEPITSCVNAVAQAAAEAALTGPQDVVEEMRLAYRRRRDLAVAILKEGGLYRYSPSGAFYQMVDIRGTGMRAFDFAVALLQQRQVAVSPGTAFGAAGEGFVRVSLASDEQLLAEGLRRLVAFARERETEAARR